MMKAISKVFIVFSACILTITSSLFSVSAEVDSEFITVPESSLGAFEYWFSNGAKSFKTFDNGNNTVRTTGSLNWGNYTSSYEGFLSKTTVNGDSSTARYIGLADLSVNITSTNSQRSDLRFETMFLTGYTQATGYDGSKSITISGGSEMYMVFMSNKLVELSNITTYTNNGVKVNVSRIYGSPKVGSYYMQCFKFTAPSYTVCTIKWGNITSTDFIRPMLLKAKSQMNDDEIKLCGQDTKTESLLFEINTNIYNIADIIVNGNNESTQKVNDNNDNTNNFNNISDDYHNIESDNIDNMQMQLDNIDTSNNELYNNGGFINAVNFISYTYMKILNEDTSNSIKLIITFSLILGLSLTIIGKLRN